MKAIAAFLRTRGRVAPTAVALLLVAGCQTYQQQSSGFSAAQKAGSLPSALTEIQKRAEASKGSKDEVIWRLEEGACLRSAALANLPVDAAPQPKAAPASAPAALPATPEEARAVYFRRSIDAFNQAEDRINGYDEEAKVKVGSELGAAFTNLAMLPYRGRAYDKVMANTYKGLSLLALGRRDDARVEFNRSLQRQREAVAANERRIAETQALAEQAREGEVTNEDGKPAAYDVRKAMRDPKTAPKLDAAFQASIAPMKAYGDYVNPFSVFLDGLFFSLNGENGADWERGRKSLERVAAMVPENRYAQADAALGAAIAEGRMPSEGITYVIFETGTAPTREEVRIDIPTFLVTNKLAYVGAAFPRLKFNDDFIRSATVTAGGQSYATETIASMDSVVANDFKNEWPTIVTKTLVTTAVKAITQATVQKQLDDKAGNLSGLFTLAAMVLNVTTTIADTRTWTSLPKEFQYARFATPADRQLVLTAGNAREVVTLGPGQINIVYAKSTGSQAPLFVSQFALR